VAEIVEEISSSEYAIDHRLSRLRWMPALCLALHALQRQYNETWLIGQHGYKAPAQGRQEQRCALAAAAQF
jgi:hypothetical protein